MAALRGIDNGTGAGTVAGTGAGTARRIVSCRPYHFPRPRLSAAALLAGRYVLVMGGFSVEHREMGDVWVRFAASLFNIKLISLVDFSNSNAHDWLCCVALCSSVPQVLDLAYGTSDQRCLLDRPAAAHRAKRFGGTTANLPHTSRTLVITHQYHYPTAAGAVVSEGWAGPSGPGGAYEAESELGEAEGGSSDEAEEEPGAADGDSDSLEGGGGAEPQGLQAQLLNQLMLAVSMLS